ncbi:MAG: hypothetical protein FWG63_07155 [Defluviitaleaceae bacterium]|nr:hypothetical protein [Defluviitaleaceae bacterium]
MRFVLGQAKVDFLESFRKFSFVAMVALALFGAVFFVPVAEIGRFSFFELMPNVILQTSNATWIPLASAMGIGFFLTITGFFYLRSGIGNDEKLGISEIILASSGKIWAYLFGKFLAGVALLAIFTAVAIFGAFVMVLVHFPGAFAAEYFSVRTFFVPYAFLLATVPITSAFAVLFGSFKLLRGAVGSTVFVFGSLMALNPLLDANALPRSYPVLWRSFDFMGMVYLQDIIKFALYEQTGDHAIRGMAFLGGFITEIPVTAYINLFFTTMPLGVYEFAGFGLTAVYSLGMVVLAAPLYVLSRRFRGAKFGLRKSRKTVVEEYGTVGEVAYFSAKLAKNHNHLAGIISEMKLMLNGRSLVWRIGAVAGIVATVFAPLPAVQIYVVPLLMLWFINAFSGLGCKEHSHNVLQIISTVERGKFRQAVYSYVAGLFVAVLLVLPVALRMATVGEFAGVVAALCAAVFVPSLAIFLGEFSKSNRFFEMLLIFMTYTAVNNIDVINYIALHPLNVSVVRAIGLLAVGVAVGSATLLRRV